MPAMMSTGRLFTKLGRLDEPDLKKYARKNKTNQTTNVPPHQLLSLDLDRSSSSAPGKGILLSTLGHLKLKADTDADSARTMDGQSTSGVLEEQETGYCGKIKR